MHCFLRKLGWLLCVGTIFAIAHAKCGAQTVTPPPPAVPSAGVPVGAPAPRLGFLPALGLSCRGCAAKIHNCKLLQAAKGPLSLLTGGLICSPADAAAAAAAAGGPPPPAVGAAAKIKRDNAAAAARAAAVRYLGTVDCHWYPEAEKALIASLRADCNECVRLAAAQALSNGCCCSPKTVEALRICAAGSDRDGNPGERCMRVRLEAYYALQNCLCQCTDGFPRTVAPYSDRPESPEQPLEPPETGEPLSQASAIRMPVYYEHLTSRSPESILRAAQYTVAQLAQIVPDTVQTAAVQTGDRSLHGIWVASSGDAPAHQNSTIQTPAAQAMPRLGLADGSPSQLPLITDEGNPRELRRLPAETDWRRGPILLSREPHAAEFR